MSIHLLSDSTSRILVSTQTLHHAASAIKELIDNALDAHATSISVEIASNTIDKIVVRDDGTGIGVEDRQLLCKRGCTSKITNLDDLAKLGGTYLGFRGTALYSVAELSKSVTIVTRVDGEQPATTLTFGSNGTLLSSASASHNVGTTVRIEDFLTTIPVRRQTALKQSAKELDEIKKLLHNYALARPTVKLSLKVLKAKNDKANWSFAACREGSQLHAAAAQVLGKAAASLCRSHSAALSEGGENSDIFKVEALLLEGKPKEPVEYDNTGQFISIDGRPVSHEKGVIKDLLKLYKSYLSNVIQPPGQVPSKPFLAAHIYCPSGSYDVNVEPAKDVVLFHDPSKVIELATKLFRSAYGEIPTGLAGVQNTLAASRSQDDAVSFNLLLARRRPITDVEVVHGSPEINTAPSSPNSKNGSLLSNFAQAMNGFPVSAPAPANHSNFDGGNTRVDRLSTIDSPYRTMELMDDDHETGNILAQQAEISLDEDEDEVYDPRNMQHNNPFIKAKLASFKTPTRSSRDSGFNSHHQGIEDASATLKSSPLAAFSPTTDRHTKTGLIRHLPTPLASPESGDTYQNPGPPFPRRSKHIHEEGENTPSMPEHPILTPRSVEQQTSLGAWMQGTASDQSIPDRSVASVKHGQDRLARPNVATVQARGLDVGKQRQSGVSTRVHKPFRSPVRQLQSQLQRDVQADLTGNSILGSAVSGDSVVTTGGSTVVDADLENILAFEHQKKFLKQEQKKMVPKKPGLHGTIGTQSSSGTNPRSMNSSILQTNIRDNSRSLDAGSSPAARPDFAAKFGDTTVETRHSSHTPNPHRNRYLAAIQKLESRQIVDSFTKSNNHESSETGDAEGHSSAISKDDPRHYLIRIQNSFPESTKSHLKTSRIQLSKLPFEIIPTEAVKHNLLAIPAHDFQPIESLLSMCQTLSINDTYVKNGGIKSIHWSPTSKDVIQWQNILQALVRQNYRSGTGPAAEDERPAADVMPDCEISLARIIKAHIESTGANDDTNTNTKNVTHLLI